VYVQVAGLLVVFGSFMGPLHARALTAVSLAALVVLSLAAAATASAANNLPASVVFSSILGSHSLPAYAALAGLSVGALATPHGSVATMIAFDRVAQRACELDSAGFSKLWLPTALLATGAATACLWLIAQIG
jgi:Na+/H+ antiporter NhaD/arsenite permease-like protein